MIMADCVPTTTSNGHTFALCGVCPPLDARRPARAFQFWQARRAMVGSASRLAFYSHHIMRTLRIIHEYRIVPDTTELACVWQDLDAPLTQAFTWLLMNAHLLPTAISSSPRFPRTYSAATDWQHELTRDVQASAAYHARVPAETEGDRYCSECNSEDSEDGEEQDGHERPVAPRRVLPQARHQFEYWYSQREWQIVCRDGPYLR